MVVVLTSEAWFVAEGSFRPDSFSLPHPLPLLTFERVWGFVLLSLWGLLLVLGKEPLEYLLVLPNDLLHASNNGNPSHRQLVAPDNSSSSSLNPNTCSASSDRDLTSNTLPHVPSTNLNDSVSSPLDQYNSSLPLNNVNMLQPITSSSLTEYSTSNPNQNLTNNTNSGPKKIRYSFISQPILIL